MKWFGGQSKRKAVENGCDSGDSEVLTQTLFAHMTKCSF